MMKHEFEALAGYEVSQKDYNEIIEPMYMATALTKEQFVKCIDKKRFALKPLKSLIKEMKKCAESLKETNPHYIDFETRDKLEGLIEEYRDRKYIVAGYGINDTIKYGYTYPVSVTIYGKKSFREYETIKLIEE